MQAHNQKEVCYIFDSEIGNYSFGLGHPMQPQRISMTHDLVLNYDLFRKMNISCPLKASTEEMAAFHTDEYLQYLRENCPIFPNLYEFFQRSAGGSIDAATKLNRKDADICIHWAGGMHYAKKSVASGFCYVNDIVLGILELLKYHQRVLYIDIDLHHGDVVEEAFCATDRVMTVSFHKYGDTGNPHDIGYGSGKYYSVNVPLLSGINDEAYESIFVAVISKVMETYQPAAIVLQCGADSLAGDVFGAFNLTLKGHGKCLEFVKSFNLPLMIVGGGGYIVTNVTRCWTYETAVALGVEIENELPYHSYYPSYAPDFKLHISPSNMVNFNTPDYLEHVKYEVFENLRMLPHAPGVQQQTIPEDAFNHVSEDEDEIGKDERMPQNNQRKRIDPGNVFPDSGDEGEGGRRDNRSFVDQPKRPRLDKDSKTVDENSKMNEGENTIDTDDNEEAAQMEN